MRQGLRGLPHLFARAFSTLRLFCESTKRSRRLRKARSRRYLLLAIAAAFKAATAVPLPQVAAQRRPIDPYEIRYYSRVRSALHWSPSELVHAIPELKKLKPATSQQDLPSILVKVGATVAAFFRDFPNTTSVEQLQEQILSATGTVAQEQLEKFHYLILATRQYGQPDLVEYRTDEKGKRIGTQDLKGGFLLTEGFAADSIFFDSAFQANSRFRYLGRETVGKRETEVVAFAQNPRARPVVEIAQVANQSAVILVQGVAWIDPVTSQIVRLRTDLLAPPPFLDLQRQTTVIDYGPVRFRNLPDTLCLPRRVVVTAEWNGRVFRNTSTYSKYQLFRVNTKLRD